MVLPDTDIVKRAIANQIYLILSSDHRLDRVRTFIRGGIPMPLPTDRYPYVEIIIGEENPEVALTGEHLEQTYIGLITVAVQLTSFAMGDWVEPVVDRFVRVPSADLVDELVQAIRDTLNQPENHDLRQLVVTGAVREVVDQFLVGDSVIYGVEGEREDSFQNFGSFPFAVQTSRQQVLNWE